MLAGNDGNHHHQLTLKKKENSQYKNNITRKVSHKDLSKI